MSRDHRNAPRSSNSLVRTAKSSTIATRAEKMRSRPDRRTRVAIRKRKAPIARRIVDAAQVSADTMLDVEEVAAHLPGEAIRALGHEHLQHRDQVVKLVEDLKDSGILPTGDRVEDAMNGAIHFKSGAYLNLGNLLASWAQGKATRFGLLPSIDETLTGFEAFRAHLFPSYTKGQMVIGARFIETEADRDVRPTDVFGLFNNRTEGSTFGIGSTTPTFKGTDSTYAGDLRRAGGRWAIGMLVYVGEEPFPILDVVTFAKTAGQVVTWAQEGAVPKIVSFFTETIGSFFGKRGVDIGRLL